MFFRLRKRVSAPFLIGVCVRLRESVFRVSVPLCVCPSDSRRLSVSLGVFLSVYCHISVSSCVFSSDSRRLSVFSCVLSLGRLVVFLCPFCVYS